MLLIIVPLLITNSKELQVEGLGMAHLSTYLSPFRVDGSIGEFYEVEGILDITVEIVDSYMYTGLRGIGVLELTAQSAADDRQGLTTEILAELEELEETKTVALEIVRIETMTEGIVPTVLIQRTVLYRSYAVLPLIACFQVCSLYDTAAGEAEYTGMHIKQSLCQVFAHTVLTTFPRVGGEEGDMLYVSRCLITSQEDA